MGEWAVSTGPVMGITDPCRNFSATTETVTYTNINDVSVTTSPDWAAHRGLKFDPTKTQFALRQQQVYPAATDTIQGIYSYNFATGATGSLLYSETTSGRRAMSWDWTDNGKFYVIDVSGPGLATWRVLEDGTSIWSSLGSYGNLKLFVNGNDVWVGSLPTLVQPQPTKLEFIQVVGGSTTVDYGTAGMTQGQPKIVHPAVKHPDGGFWWYIEAASQTRIGYIGPKGNYVLDQTKVTNWTFDERGIWHLYANGDIYQRALSGGSIEQVLRVESDGIYGVDYTEECTIGHSVPALRVDTTGSTYLSGHESSNYQTSGTYPSDWDQQADWVRWTGNVTNSRNTAASTTVKVSV